MIQVFNSHIASAAVRNAACCFKRRCIYSGIVGGVFSGVLGLTAGGLVVGNVGPAIANVPESISDLATEKSLQPAKALTDIAAAQLTPQPVFNAARNPLAAQALYRELEKLTGRVESTYLSNRAQNQPTQLRAVDPSLTASGSVGSTVPTPLPAELQAAQQLLNEWQDLISTGKYETAQRRFETVSASLRNAQLNEAQLIGRASRQPEVRSIWLDRETIVNAGSHQGLAKIFERFKAAGINTVFVETVNAGYPIYPSAVAPQRNPLTQSWDPLQAAVQLGKSYNIEVHAWVWLFAASNQAHNRIVGKPTEYPGPVLAAYPDWAGFDSHGNLIIPGQTKAFLDPANPEVRQYLFNLLGEIADRYDVDGIQFDYVRYPFQDPANNRHFGYGNAARQQFHKLTGVDPITLSPKNGGDRTKAHLWHQWTNFRTQQISTFVAEASERLRRQRPDIKISAAVFADGTRKRQQALQQDWEDWADQGLIDWIVLMSYASTTQRFDELIRPWVVESSYRSTKVIPGIRLLNLPAAVALDQLQLLRDLPTSGYALFAADNLNGDVQTMLTKTQGGDEIVAVAKNSYTTAFEQYQSLQQEWNWLLTNQQIQGDAQRLAQWTTEVNQIGVALAALGEEASERELRQVRSRLARLKRSLPQSFTLQTASTPYRLRAWQHRISAIQQLVKSS